jgi:hypothetical protein
LLRLIGHHSDLISLKLKLKQRFSLTTLSTLACGIDQARDHVLDEVIVLQELNVVRLENVDRLREASRDIAL